MYNLKNINVFNFQLILTDDIDQFSVKRIIINSVNNDDSASFFDTNYKGKNDISLTSLKLDLETNGMESAFESKRRSLQTCPINLISSLPVSRQSLA